MKFRKKPVVIEAIQFQQPTSLGEAPGWLTEAVTRGDFLVVDGVARITTLEGIMTAQPGDWIIRGVKGEIYPCKPDIFAATYEAADQQPATTAREQALEELVRSACAIAERKGASTAWDRFTASAGALGLNGVTARTYRVLPSDAE
jgi:hypothetical protein